ncbi:MAG: hypothetical protein A4E73_00570 [Syntrophaceae bacterium PtaU1.Bin231]|nr:MAG: hypothetical protein A4E73_00570 [Syntrophaceae bacterium PtaU1.Bin231]
MEIVSRFFKPPDSSFFLVGPRGTGKSTFVKGQYGNALYIDLLDPERIRFFSARPERLKEIVDANPRSVRIIVDEIQRVPEMLTVIHKLMEEKKGVSFVLTGSSARKLKRAGVDLLGGRALLHSMHPFMAGELGNEFHLGKALQYGLLPLIVRAEDPDEVLRSYTALYLREEVQMEGLVRNVGNFSRFLEAISFSHASILNISNVSRECEVERKVVESYVTLLEDILLGWRLPVFTRKAKRALAAHPKFYLFDTGVFRALRPRGPLDQPAEIEGQALEGLVAQHLRAWTAYSRTRRDLFYWRTRSGVEVDFVVYGPEGLWAVEVKSSTRIHPGDLRGLLAFREEYPECKTFLIYGGKDRLVKSDVLCVPCFDFLMGLHPDRTLDELGTG